VEIAVRLLTTNGATSRVDAASGAFASQRGLAILIDPESHKNICGGKGVLRAETKQSLRKRAKRTKSESKPAKLQPKSAW
jgi:hypothetical protein